MRRAWSERSFQRPLATGREAGYTVCMKPDDDKRLANSVIHDWLARHDGLDLRVGFVCECSRAGCTEAVWLTGEQFERATRDPASAACTSAPCST